MLLLQYLFVMVYVSMQSVTVAVNVITSGATYVRDVEVPQLFGDAGTVA